MSTRPLTRSRARTLFASTSDIDIAIFLSQGPPSSNTRSKRKRTDSDTTPTTSTRGRKAPRRTMPEPTPASSLASTSSPTPPPRSRRTKNRRSTKVSGPSGTQSRSSVPVPTGSKRTRQPKQPLSKKAPARGSRTMGPVSPLALTRQPTADRINTPSPLVRVPVSSAPHLASAPSSSILSSVPPSPRIFEPTMPSTSLLSHASLDVPPALHAALNPFPSFYGSPSDPSFYVDIPNQTESPSNSYPPTPVINPFDLPSESCPPSPTGTEIIDHPESVPQPDYVPLTPDELTEREGIKVRDFLFEPHPNKLKARDGWNAMHALMVHDHHLRNPSKFQRLEKWEKGRKGKGRRRSTEKEVVDGEEEEVQDEDGADERTRGAELGTPRDLWRLCAMGWLNKEEMIARGWWDPQTVAEVEAYEAWYASNTYFNGEPPRWVCYPPVENDECPSPAERIRLRRALYQFTPCLPAGASSSSSRRLGRSDRFEASQRDEISDAEIFGFEVEETRPESLSQEEREAKRKQMGISAGPKPLQRTSSTVRAGGHKIQ